MLPGEPAPWGQPRNHAAAFPQWAVLGPQIYLATRLQWDPFLDTEALLDKYLDRLYGPAGDAAAVILIAKTPHPKHFG